MQSTKLNALIPDGQTVVELDEEELGRVILKSLHDWPQITHEVYESGLATQYPSKFRNSIGEKVSESWAWLLSRRYLAQKPGQRDNVLFITDKGKSFAAGLATDELNNRQFFKKQLFHPEIADISYADFSAGRYKVAILNAYIRIEERVRLLSKASKDLVGVQLMYFGFQKSDLANKTLASGEQTALANLFAGAFGYIRNPQAHSMDTMTSNEAGERLMVASFLMRELDAAEARLATGTNIP